MNVAPSCVLTEAVGAGKAYQQPKPQHRHPTIASSTNGLQTCGKKQVQLHGASAKPTGETRRKELTQASTAPYVSAVQGDC